MFFSLFLFLLTTCTGFWGDIKEFTPAPIQGLIDINDFENNNNGGVSEPTSNPTIEPTPQPIQLNNGGSKLQKNTITSIPTLIPTSDPTLEPTPSPIPPPPPPQPIQLNNGNNGGSKLKTNTMTPTPVSRLLPEINIKTNTTMAEPTMGPTPAPSMATTSLPSSEPSMAPTPPTPTWAPTPAPSIAPTPIPIPRSLPLQSNNGSSNIKKNLCIFYGSGFCQSPCFCEFDSTQKAIIKQCTNDLCTAYNNPTKFSDFSLIESETKKYFVEINKNPQSKKSMKLKLEFFQKTNNINGFNAVKWMCCTEKIHVRDDCFFETPLLPPDHFDSSCYYPEWKGLEKFFI